MNTYTNISGYKFVKIENPSVCQKQLLEKTKALGLRGTILISEEGINIALVGREQDIHEVVTWLDTQIEFRDIHFKYSISNDMPFSKMMVKIKPEIIRMDKPEAAPEKLTGPHISPETFKAWLDEGKPVTILDTRNEYEIAFGKFTDAIHFNIDHFRQFPDKAKSYPKPDTPIVMYCTGGVRCEKASSFMLQNGFTEVYQLDGGIIHYFEKCGDAHYEGECFVFDDRISLNSALEETGTHQCIDCGYPIAANAPQHVCHQKETL